MWSVLDPGAETTTSRRLRLVHRPLNPFPAPRVAKQRPVSLPSILLASRIPQQKTRPSHQGRACGPRYHPACSIDHRTSQTPFRRAPDRLSRKPFSQPAQGRHSALRTRRLTPTPARLRSRENLLFPVNASSDTNQSNVPAAIRGKAKRPEYESNVFKH